MTRRFFGILGALAGAALVTGSCVEDPLSNLDGTPAAIVTSHSALQLTQGAGGIAVTASVVDGRSTPLAVPVTFAPCDAAVVVVADPTYDPVPSTSARDTVRGVSPAASCVNISGGGLTKQLPVIVLPTAFNGTASATTVQTGQVLTFTASASLRFDPATANVNFGGGYRGTVTNRTATSLSVIVPIPNGTQPHTLTLENVDVTYVTGLRVNLPTAQTFTVTNPNRPNDAPIPTVTATVPADTIFDGFDGGEVDNFYTVNVAAATTFTVTLDWAGSADLDVFFCNVACNALVGGAGGATSANPETYTVTLNPGQYNLVVENFVTSGATPAVPLYRLRITP
jgi:hypothetical protein